jgi:methionine sulfoxide reductase heme-binding subunit
MAPRLTPFPWAPEKVAAAALAMAPAVWLAWLAGEGGLGARPVIEAIRFSGDWALRLLWVVLLIGPARRILNAPRLIRTRRVLGVGVFGLCALHFGLYALDQGFDWFQVARETVLRLYLAIGAIALIGLAALAATSSDRAVARLGGVRWNLLHQSIYILAGLSAVHFLLRSRTDTFEPMLMFGLLAWLVGYRLLHRLTGDVTPHVLLGLAAACGALTAAAEVAWHAAATGVDPLRILAAHLDLSYGLRPAWWVLIAGLAAAAAGWRLRLVPHRPAARMTISNAASGSTRGQSAS